MPSSAPRLCPAGWALLCAAVALLAAGEARAGEQVVRQADKRFTPATISAKVGDKIVFVNDDRYAHNVFSQTPGYEFNVRKQMPGDRDEIVLDKSGRFTVRCAIHPRMRLTVDVE